MRYLQLSVAPAEEPVHPLFPVMAGAPFVERAQMLDWNATRSDTTTALFRMEAEVGPFAAALDAEPVVLDHEITPRDGPEFYAYIHSEATANERRLWRAFSRERSLLVPPIEYGEDGVTCRIVGSADELRAALDDVPDGLAVSVERVGEFDGRPADPAAALTDRQREVVRAAVAAGYYEVPRGATAADIGERVGCTPSTASEHLRKAEARVMSGVVE